MIMLYISRFLIGVNKFQMKEFLEKFLIAISGDLVRLLESLISCVDNIFDLMSMRREDKKEAKQKKEENDFSKKVDKVADKGSLNDLLDLKR